MTNQKITPDTIIRTVILALALINQALTASGRNPLPFAESEIYELLSLLATIGASLWAWWKNNSFTKPAIEADKYMRHLKTQKKIEEEQK